MVKKSLFLLFATLFISGCSGEKNRETVPVQVVKGVTLETIKLSDLPETLEVVGTIKARTVALVSSRIPGSVVALHANAGDRVGKGELLARLEASELKAQSMGSAAAIEDAHAGVAEAKSRSKLADATFERYKKLYEDQALTRQEFEQKQAERDLARQGLLRVEARLRQAEEAGRATSAIADYARITAPFAGVVALRQVELGSTVFPGQPLFTVEDEGSYLLELAVPESFGSKIRVGTPLVATIDASGATVSAKVTEVAPASDPANRTFMVKAALSGTKGLRSGMFARASLELGSSASRLLLPKTAVFERGALTAVWVVDQEQIARMRLVKPGRELAGKIEVLSGVSSGERVVVAGVEKLVDGVRVE